MAQRGTSAPMFRTNGAKIKVAAFVIVALLFIAYLSRSSEEPYRPPKNSEENSDKDTPPKDTPPMEPPKGPPPKETKPPVKLPDRPEDLVEPTFSYPSDQDPNNAYGHTFAPTPSYQNREDMKCYSNCGGNGWCFLGKCYCYPGYKGRYCNVPWTQKPPLCDLKSDSCFVTSHGVAMVSRDRWLYAQKAEQSLWSNNQATDDRAQEHVDGFKGYASVPDNLGHVLEVGCGPWTQSKFMLQQRNTFKVETMTLWEPGLLFYVQNTPTCTYKDGNFLGLSTVLVNAGAELLLLHEEYDTVILINVLEHVQNAFQIMENVVNSLKPGGILIFNDRWWDTYDFYGYKVGGEFGLWGQDRLYHPIHLKKEIFEHMMSFFDVLLDNRDAVALTSRQLTGTYFIGRKKKKN